MKTHTMEVRIGENMGPVDWSHPTASVMPEIWHDAEKNPDGYLLNGKAIYAIAMYDGWPYWRPTPAVMFAGPIGAEWAFFDSYGVHQSSIEPASRATGEDMGSRA